MTAPHPGSPSLLGLLWSLAGAMWLAVGVDVWRRLR